MSSAVPNYETDNPCIGLCTGLYDDVCQGCGRTIQETANWFWMTPAERVIVWQRIEREGTCVRFKEPHRVPK
jgi:predicted Fe-S protein YdhL (DUF1289 family)